MKNSPGIRSMVIAVTALVVVAMLAIATVFTEDSWSHSQAAAQVAVNNLSYLLERQLGESLTKLDISLQTVVSEVDRELARDGRIAPADLSDFLSLQQGFVPEIDYFRGTDAQGIVRYGRGVSTAGVLDISDRGYFQQLKAHPELHSVFFGPLRTKDEKQWVIGIARPLHDRNGKFNGVILASTTAAKFQQMLAKVQLGKHGAVTIRTLDLALVARTPSPPQTDDPQGIGSRLVSKELAQALRDNPRAGHFLAVTSLDGIERINAYTRIGDYPLYVLCGLSTQDYQSEWRQDATATFALAAVAILITIAASALILRALEQQQKAFQRVSDSERRFRNFFENNVSVMLLIAPESGRILAANRAALRYYGFSEQAIAGMSIDNINTLSQEEIRKERELARANERNFFRFRHRLASGECRDVEVYSTPVNLDGKVILFSLVQDVTDRNIAAARLKESEARYQRVMDGSDEGYWEWNLATGSSTVSPRYEAMLGYLPGEWTPTFANLYAHCDPDDVARVQADFEAHLQGLTPHYQCEFRIRTKQGNWIWINARGKVVERDGDGNATIVAGIHADVTSRRMAEDALKVMHKDFVTLLDSSSDFLYFKDKDSKFRYCSQTMAQLTGHASWRDMVGKHDHDVFPAAMAKVYYDEEQPIFRDGIPLLNQVDPYVRLDGTPGWVSTNKWPIFEDDGKTIAGIFGISRDITEAKNLENNLRWMVETDFLTGVATRRTFIGTLEQELARARRDPSGRWALLMFDLDHFKVVNDTYGHAAGDAVLQHLTRLMSNEIRKIDLIGRLGGEEFGILLPGTDLAAASAFAERLRQLVQDSPLRVDHDTIAVTISIGLTAISGADDSADQCLARTDKALYQAKRTGRNRVEICLASGQ